MRGALCDFFVVCACLSITPDERQAIASSLLLQDLAFRNATTFRVARWIAEIMCGIRVARHE